LVVASWLEEQPELPGIIQNDTADTMWACELCTWQSQTGAKSETPRVAMQFANCHKAAIVSNILMQ